MQNEPAALKITPLIYIHERLPIRTRALWAAFKKRNQQITFFFFTLAQPASALEVGGVAPCVCVCAREPRRPLALLAVLSAAVFQHV